MSERFPEKAEEIMNERFHHDSLIALATMDGNKPSVRTVNSFYENGAFYISSKEEILKTKCRITYPVDFWEMEDKTIFEIDEPKDIYIVEKLFE